MDVRTENFIKHLELNVQLSNVYDIEKWGQTILSDLIKYYGSHSQYQAELKSILSSYKNSSQLSYSSDFGKQNSNRAEFEIKELLKRILYAERSIKQIKSVENKLEETRKSVKESIQSPVDTKNKQDNHPEKRVYSLTFNQIMGLLTFFVGLISGSYLLGKDNGAKYSEHDFQKKDDIISNWQDTVKLRDSRIAYVMKNSDSAAQIVPTLKYDTLPLTSSQKQIIQHYMESVYEVLSLNKK